MDQALGQRVGAGAIDQRFGRVVRLPVPAAAQHHLDSGRLRDASHALRVAPQSDVGQVHDAASACRGVGAKLFDRQRFVVEDAVQTEPRVDPFDVQQQVLVGLGEAELAGGQRAAHGHDGWLAHAQPSSNRRGGTRKRPITSRSVSRSVITSARSPLTRTVAGRG